MNVTIRQANIVLITLIFVLGAGLVLSKIRFANADFPAGCDSITSSYNCPMEPGYEMEYRYYGDRCATGNTAQAPNTTCCKYACHNVWCKSPRSTQFMQTGWRCVSTEPPSPNARCSTSFDPMPGLPPSYCVPSTATFVEPTPSPE